MIEGLHYKTGEAVAIEVEGGVIRAVRPIAAREGLPFVGPGLVDLQINGVGGHDFNATPIAEGALGEAVRLLAARGVTSFFPTVITNSAEAIEGNLATIARVREADAAVGAAVAGVHLEGPFISPEDGARGAHAREFVRGPDWDVFRRWQEAARGLIRIVTLSPEWPGAVGFIERAAASGVVVSIGHTAATAEQVAEAVRAGARLSTHFGNGAHLMLPRHPNYLWEQLAQDGLSTCLIADGFHLPDQVIKVVMRVKGERAMLVSDAVSLAGLAPGAYTTPVGGRVVLRADGKLHLAENEKLLAGSARLLAEGIEHLVGRGLASLGEAWEMGSVRPAGLMGMGQGAGLAVGAPADVVEFRRAGGGVRVERTYKAGVAV